jgi:hypothetical protein
MVAPSRSDEVYLTSRARSRSESDIGRDERASKHLGQTDVASIAGRHIGAQAVHPNHERETRMARYWEIGQVVDCCPEAPNGEISPSHLFRRTETVSCACQTSASRRTAWPVASMATPLLGWARVARRWRVPQLILVMSSSSAAMAVYIATTIR